MRHIDRGIPERLLALAEFNPEPFAEDRVEGREGLVEEHEARANSEGSRKRHALPLAPPESESTFRFAKPSSPKRSSHSAATARLSRFVAPNETGP